MNVLVTVIHVLMILIFTILGFLVDNVIGSSPLQVKMSATWVCFGGFLDIVVSYMMFFIFDENREMMTNLVKDYRFRLTYQVYDVIKVNETE